MNKVIILGDRLNKYDRKIIINLSIIYNLQEFIDKNNLEKYDFD